MVAYMIRRVLMMVPLLIGITIITFAVVHLAPGEPVDQMTDLNPKASLEAKDRLRALYGLDQPLPVQYWRWVSRLAVLDFGTSFSSDRRPVLEKTLERMPITIGLNVLSMLFIFLIALPIGIVAAVRQGSLFDNISTVLVFLFFSVPTFWLALLGMILFGIKLGWLPISGLRSIDFDQLSLGGQVLDYARHLVMPVVIGSIGGLAGISRFMRSGMLEVVRQDYVRTARAKGVPERLVIWRHALRNALLPIVTILGFSIPGLIAGSVIFETIFAIPGIGQLMWQAVMARDYPMIMGNLVVSAALTLAGNLLADLGYVLVDPRISFEGRG